MLFFVKLVLQRFMSYPLISHTNAHAIFGRPTLKGKVNYQPQGRYGKLATVKDSKTDVSGVSPSSAFKSFTVANLPYRPCG